MGVAVNSLVLPDAEDAVFADGYFMGISAQVFHYGGYAAKGAFGVDVPAFKTSLLYLLIYLHALGLQ